MSQLVRTLTLTTVLTIASFANSTLASPLNLLPAKSIHVCDKRGNELYSRNADARLEAASTQKLLTALIIVKDGNLEELVKITRNDLNCQPIHLPKSHECTFSRMQLLNAMLVKSANDAARALARDNAGSQEAFAKKMNDMARSLGAKSSNFITSSGLPAPGQYSTARDMTIIGMAAYKNPTIRRIVKQLAVPWSDRTGHSDLHTVNTILRRNSNECQGLKTGYTDAAGHCAVIAWKGDGQLLFATVLNGKAPDLWDTFPVMLRVLSTPKSSLFH